jgi:hypothetical protein
LRHYATGWKVVGSILSEVIGYFAIYLILPAAGVDPASITNEYQESSWQIKHAGA